MTADIKFFNGTTWVSLKGPKGDPGVAATIKGTKALIVDLPTEGNTTGDGWIVEENGDLYVWSGTTFTNVGKIVGPAGQDGTDGTDGHSITVSVDTSQPGTPSAGDFWILTS